MKIWTVLFLKKLIGCEKNYLLIVLLIIGNLFKFVRRKIKMMKKNITTEIIVKENKIGIMRVGNVNYISLTDI